MKRRQRRGDALKRRNPVARLLRGAAFQVRRTRSKKRYTRKAKHQDTDQQDTDDPDTDQLSARGATMLRLQAQRPRWQSSKRFNWWESAPMRICSLIACIPLAAASHAMAADLPGDPVAGGQLAHEVCAACHLVAKDQASDPEIGPSLIEVAEHPASTEMSLRVYLQTPHATMPDIILTPQETDDVISYILTLKGS